MWNYRRIKFLLLLYFPGYLDSEPDDIDVPLSKRINRLNIENPALSTSKEHPVLPALHAVNNGGTSVAHLHPESSNTSMNENRNLISYSQLQTFSNPPSFSGSVQGELQSNNLPINQNASLPGYSVMPGSMHHIDDIRDLAYSNIHSSPSGTFKERYNYPENSQYFKSNQLLNSLFLERQVRHNSWICDQMFNIC